MRATVLPSPRLLILILAVVLALAAALGITHELILLVFHHAHQIAMHYHGRPVP